VAATVKLQKFVINEPNFSPPEQLTAPVEKKEFQYSVKLRLFDDQMNSSKLN